MAARREISQRKAQMLNDLRAKYRGGHYIPGQVAPSVRELARAYELSVGVVGQQLQVLVQEGLFYTVSGAGTFVGRPQSGSAKFFLFVLPSRQLKPPLGDRYYQIQAGFEDEITRRGGASLAMTHDQVVAQMNQEAMPPLDGVFVYHPEPDSSLMELLNARANAHPGRALPEVDWGGFSEMNPRADCINFDNSDGGEQATQHLLSSGHRRIAFLGAHAVDDARDIEWSVERQRGWQTALSKAGLSADGLAFLPRKLAAVWVSESDALLYEAAQRLIAEADCTAVVAANDLVALQLIEACRTSGVPSAQWPAIVSFDDTTRDGGYVLTSLRLPWEELGRVAAELLWDRAHGQITGAPVTRRIAMRVIPRLSCRTNWPLSGSHLAAPGMNALPALNGHKKTIKGRKKPAPRRNVEVASI